MTKHKIKMIVTDLDGTLLRSDKTISKRSKAVLNKCRERGIKVVYATARGGTAIKLASSQYFDGRVVCNGSLAYLGDTEVYKRQIPYQIIRSLLTGCDRRGLKVTSEAGNIHYSNFIVTDIWPIVTNYEVADFSTFALDAQKLCIIFRDQEDIEFISKYLTEELYLYLSRDDIAMVMHRDAVKSKAVAALAQIWGINMSEVVAFGDDLNDVDMLKAAGTSVAMENAIDEVKAVSDLVCLGNDQDGVAEWLERNVLQSDNPNNYKKVKCNQ